MARPRRTLLLTGIAEGLGAEIAETFAQAGHDVIGLSRGMKPTEHLTRRVEQAGGSYTHLACDITRAADATAAIKPHADRIDVLIHNPHLLTIKPFEQTTTEEFEQAWRVACLGAVISAQAVVPHMAARQQGTIIFTGATAGLRGAANFSAFASAKFALRGLAQSLAREYAPKGVHVAHVVPRRVDRRAADRSALRIASPAGEWIRARSRRPISICRCSRRRPGPMRWICGRFPNAFEERRRCRKNSSTPTSPSAS